MMLNAIPLKCPNCGANLNIAPEMSQFACGYCGASQVVERSGGTVSLRLITDAIRQVQHGTDRTAAELALRRLQEESTALQQNISAMQGNKRYLKYALETKWRNIAIAYSIFFFFMLVGGLSGGAVVITIFAIIFWATSGYFTYKVYAKQSQDIENRFEPLLQQQYNQGAYIQNKINENRRILG